MSDWRNLMKAQIAKKRTGGRAKEDQEAKLTTKVFRVQRLSAEVGGAWQKYSRVGPLSAVRMENFDKNDIKKFIHECKKVFEVDDLEAELLCTDRGPPAESLDELNIDKVIHIRFFKPVRIRNVSSQKSIIKGWIYNFY